MGTCFVASAQRHAGTTVSSRNIVTLAKSFQDDDDAETTNLSYHLVNKWLTKLFPLLSTGKLHSFVQ
jgi:hypothetical protein